MPSSGRKRTTFSTAASDMPPAPEQRARDAEEHEPGVEMEAPGLQPAEHGRAAAGDRGQGVQRAVDQGAIAEAQEGAVGYPDQRLAEAALVQLVDEVLAREPAVRPGEARTQPLGPLGRPAEQPRRRREAG